MSKVKDFMSAEVISVCPDDTIDKVMKILNEKNIKALPVLDEKDKVIGMITARDLLKHSENSSLFLFPYSFELGVSPYGYTQTELSFEKSSKEFLKTKVADAMQKKVHTLSEDDSWHEAALHMKKKGVNRLPVVDEEGKLKGIVTRTDLLNYLAEDKEL